MRRVFVVEDEAVVAMELKDHLRALGYEVCGHAAKGEVALREIPETRPDLVLMDINLGPGMTGLDVAEGLRGLLDAPILFLTAYSDAEFTERAGRSGAFAYIVKPFDPRVLKANIELALVRHENKAALRESEARFRALFEQAAVGVAEVDSATGRFVRVNRKYAEIMGYSVEELLALDFMSITHPDDLALGAVLVDRLKRGELREFTLEKRYLRKDGSVLLGSLTVSPLWAPGEPPTRHMAVLLDITARRRAEEALREERFLLAESQRIAGIGTWKAALPTGETTWTDETYRLYGQSRESFVPGPESLLSLLHPDDRGKMQEWIAASFTGALPPPLEFRVPLADGSVRVLRGHGEVIRDERGAPTALVGTAQDITERVKAAAALTESEERYRSLFDEAIEGMFRTGLDGTILAANPAFARLVGYDSPETLVGTSTLSFYADPAERSALQERQAGQDELAGEQVTWRRRNGEIISVEIHGRLLRDERGVPSHYQGFVRDVSRQKQHADALRVLSTGLAHVSGTAFFEEAAAQLAAIVGAEIGFVGALRSDPTQGIRTLGFVIDGERSPSIDYALAGTPCEDVLSGCVLVCAENVQRRYPVDKDLVALGAEGYLAAPLIGAGGQVIGHVGVMTRRPIATPGPVESVVRLFALRMATELERQRAEARFVSVFELAPDALLIVGEAGRIVLANRLAEETFGYSREELLGLTVEALVPITERSGHRELRGSFHAEPSLRRMGRSRSRLRALRKDGTKVPVEISLGPLHSEEGRLVVAVVRDVSERAREEETRERLEDALRQAQKMESLGTLAGGIAHDFNNILTAIVTNVELARADVAPTDPIVESLEDIATAASRATDLVKQILAFSRRQPSRRRVTSVLPILEEVSKLLRASIPAGVEIVTTAGADVPAVFIDPTQFHQMLMNLGTNAWQSIDRMTGKISLLLDAVSFAEGAPRPFGLRPGRYTRVRVSDDGKGMDAAIVERIFEPFFTTKGVGKGTGLGLAMVHGIVADHGGAIAVESFPGVGTTFSVYLPEAESVPSGSLESPPQALRGSGRVLLVDDEEALVRSTARVLSRLGYQVTRFVRAVEALEAVRADPDRFDVVVTDQNMPEMSGLELARSISSLRPALPIVLVTGNRTQSDDELGAANVRYRLDKPYTAELLSEVLARALKGS